MANLTRRQFNRNVTLAGAGAALGVYPNLLPAQIAGERPVNSVGGVRIDNPLGRIPVSFIIDDSTCLVNMAYYGIPQFAEVFPDRYMQPWRSLPREIPDSFVRKFGEWCHEHGVKGKYSIVPYPACVGWVDRVLPGWTKRELKESLDLVRTLMLPDWDIHPEMVSHTVAVDTRTGRPYAEYKESNMENWGFSVGKSVDELTDYLSYALRILKNVDLPCEGITTPGGFGNKVLPELAQATLESCRHVFNAEIPHYFRHLYTDERSVAPRVEYASGLKGSDPRCVVSIIGCTGDWFGGWDGLSQGSLDKFIAADLQSGRMVDVIDRGEPAVMVCHWPGIYYNGEETGFNIFKEIVNRIHQRYDNLIWLKLSEIARYWAARELTGISKQNGEIVLSAPFSTMNFTLVIESSDRTPKVMAAGKSLALSRVNDASELKSRSWFNSSGEVHLCFDLPRGESRISLV